MWAYQVTCQVHKGLEFALQHRVSETMLLAIVQSSLLSNSESLVRVPLNHSYPCPVLDPKYNRVAESVFPTSAWQVGMWVFRDVYGEEERDSVKDGMWTGEM